MTRVELLARRNPLELEGAVNERLRVLEADGTEIVDIKYAAVEDEYTAMIVFRVRERSGS
jgi:uncharacterized protein YkuJ